METFKDLPVIAFASQEAWRQWLDENHQTAPGVCLRIYKKDSKQPTVTYAEALDEALCYGWIDSTKYKYDDQSFLQRFSPRKPRSVWSQVNRVHVARLTDAGKIMPAGQAMIDIAKQNGQWEAAYASQSKMEIPADFQAVLDQHPEAQAHFDTLNKVNRYAILYRIQNVKKAETRLKRIQWALDILLNKEKIH